MKKFVFVYFGSDITASASQEERKASMDQWMAWFGTFQDKMVDSGNPFPPGGQSVSAKGVTTVTDMASTGYTIINVEDMDEAVELAKGCPLVTTSGSVQVYEAMPM